jgi:exo-1,4-beta-D-glucosaminidase
MLNNAWPSMIWHLYDYYLEPGGGYFGARKANEPLHIQFSHDDRSVVLVNSEQRPFQALQASVELYDFNLERKFSQQLTVDVPADSNLRLLTIPDPEPDVKASFVRLSVQDSTGRMLSSNFYWLPAKYSTFDWASTTYVYTPSPSYEDLTQLAQLTEVKLEMSATAASSGKRPSIQVRLHNPSKHLAFQVSLRAFNQKDGHDILPVLWDNNYFELMPGESTTITATYDAGELQNVRPAVQVGGWNIVPQTKTLFPGPSSENRGQ